jgi:hypothetical protein
MGKGVGRVANLCRQHKIPCLALAGIVAPEAKTARLFSATFGLTEITSLKNALQRPAHHLEMLGALAARSAAFTPLQRSKRAGFTHRSPISGEAEVKRRERRASSLNARPPA